MFDTKKSNIVALLAAIVVVSIGAQAFAQTASVTYNNVTGDIVVTADPGLLGIEIVGPDVGCVSPYCNGDNVAGFGVDSGLLYSVINFYTPGTMTNEWGFLNLGGSEGADFLAGNTVANIGGLTAGDFGGFNVTYGDSSSLMGSVVVVPEPATAAFAVLGLLGVVGIRRRMR